MKNTRIAFVFLVAALWSCNRGALQPATVVHDCTGTYLRLDGKDYQVCNRSELNGYSNGAMVKASFRKILKCEGDTGVVCMMYHENEGWIEVKKVE